MPESGNCFRLDGGVSGRDPARPNELHPHQQDFPLSMNESMQDYAQTPLLVLLGPTASGKTALSLRLAEHFGGEIVSCDSVAVYREMEIGTAKPTFAERRKIPHHMIDVASLSDAFTAGEYARQARVAIAEITAKGRLPIITGGTGLYLRALIDGLFPAPPRCEELRMTRPSWYVPLRFASQIASR